MLALILGFSLFAQTHYPMHVVKEAWVGKKSYDSAGPALACQTKTQASEAKEKLSWIGSQDRKPEVLFSLNQNSKLLATRNTDDAYLNSVTLWLSVSSKNKTLYYELADIDMENYELPQVQLVNDTLIIKANILKADPKEDNEFAIGLPVLKSQLYQTIRISESSKNQLQIQSLICIQ